MQVCIWRAFTSHDATPYSIGIIQAAECYFGPSGKASIQTAQAGTYIVQAVIIRTGITQFDSADVLSETAYLSVTVNELLQVDLERPDHNNDERMQRLQQSLHSMGSALKDSCNRLSQIAIDSMSSAHDAVLCSVLMDASVDPDQLRTDVELQPLLETECAVSTCTAQLSALQTHPLWKEVSTMKVRQCCMPVLTFSRLSWLACCLSRKTCLSFIREIRQR
jgi:hypothetical protein